MSKLEKMNTKEKIKLLSQKHTFGIRKLIELGDSYALTIPKLWVLMNCTELDDSYYLQLNIEDNKLIFMSIDEKEIESISVKEKK